MDSKKEEFMIRLLSTFRVEADEHIKALSSGLIQLEKSNDSAEQARVIETLFREAHSLKGAARSVDSTGIESVCQHLEGILRRFKHRGFRPDPGIFDVLHRAVDIIEKLNTPGIQELPETSEIVLQLRQIEEGSFLKPGPKGNADMETNPAGPGGRDKTARRKILADIEAGIEARRLKKQQYPAAEKENRPGTVRLSTAKLESVLLQSEEMIYGKLSLTRLAGQLDDIREELANRQKKYFDGGYSADCDIKSLAGKIREVSRSLENDRRIIGTLIDTHLEDMKELLMLPFSTLTVGFPKTVRDLARDKGKRVDITIEGADSEIDKRVLEAVKDPLLHLVRNAVDHGIEAPEERVRQGKPPAGTIHMIISRFESSKVQIRFADDGAGIDMEKVKDMCIRSGILTKEEIQKQTDSEILEMIFHSEFSTSPLVTDISGRGLGLAIAREKVEKLGGSISVDTEVHKGTVFRLTLPLTLAVFRGVLVKAGEAKFILPTLNVERVIRVRTEEIKTVENRETIIVHDRAVSHVPLVAVLGLQPHRLKSRIEKKRDIVQMLILNAEGMRIAFSVDDILDEEEVLVKDLGSQLQRVINISGAAILSSSDVVPILNVSDLIKSAVKTSFAPPLRAMKDAKTKPKSLLLVEDSITSRILLKNILESAGYRVTVAVDGMAGWTSLRQTPVDVVISDVDMPRLNGFELTAKIRGDKKLSSTPVVLVTGMETREDREKGMEVGADAYIVKSSFDQSNLLAVLKKIV
jgi:two-component system chemotaxis sensor kinase CheA